MSVVAIGLLAIFVTTAVFVAAVLTALTHERRRARRDIRRVEDKLEELMYMNMSPYERQREIDRIRAIEQDKQHEQDFGA